MTSTSELWTGGRVSPRAACVLGPNPGVMTLDGTNTWVLREPGADEVVVVDPGPLDEAHLAAVLGRVAEDDGAVALVLLTHHHHDHAESAERFAALTGAPVRGAGRGEPLHDGERIAVGPLELEVVASPGHTADSVSLLVPADRLLLSGDTVLGRGTTVIAWPDGDLASYLATLARLTGLVDAGRVERIAPGHGPLLADPGAVLAGYRAHREERLTQLRAALDGGAASVGELVAVVYGELEDYRATAAVHTVQAQLAYLGVELPA
jgi:glyoxylase-like metal-dependent hydrolase (beta-lactamase superfamily II)